MKKVLIVILVLLMSVVVFAGCNDDSETQTVGPLKIVSKYEKTAEATRIEQKIEIKYEGVAAYVYEKTLEKAEDKYDVHEVTKRPAKVEVDEIPAEQYEVSENDYTLNKAAEGVTTLDIKKEYFVATELTITDDSLRGQVNDADVEKLLTFVERPTSEVKSLVIEIQANDEAVTKITMHYRSEVYTVEITLTYAYAE